MVILPANVRHLIHPLDIDIFKPFKSVLNYCASEFMVEHAVTAIIKIYMMAIG